jgi:hypothetical protein
MRHDRRSHFPRRPALALGLVGLLAAALVVLVPLTRGRATAPPVRYTVMAETVLDTETDLLWQRAVPASFYTWSGALAYCEGLSLGGFSDWRLPNIKELQTLVDDREYSPAIDTTAFPATPLSYFWSSSPFANNATSAWVVWADDGHTYTWTMTNVNRVRCVR